MHTTNYYDTFIAVADDCPITAAEIPPLKSNEKTIAGLQFDMMVQHPYKYNSDEVVFGVYATRKGITGNTALSAEREAFFSKGQPCLRSSPLTKRYGWGVHSNAEGKVALYALESVEYKQFLQDETIKKVKGMRSSKT